MDRREAISHDISVRVEHSRKFLDDIMRWLSEYQINKLNAYFTQ